MKTEKYVKNNGLDNKLIIQCSFNEDLTKVSSIESEGCRGFLPIITSNGLCYTFNGESVTKVWKPSEIMDTFNQLFPHNNIQNEEFGGTGAVQGNINSTVPSAKFPGYNNLRDSCERITDSFARFLPLRLPRGPRS